MIARDTDRARRLLTEHIARTTRILLEAKVVEQEQRASDEDRAAS